MFTNVIAGVDGRDGGRAAAALAAVLSGGRLTLVGVHAQPSALLWDGLTGYDEILKADTEDALTAVRAGLPVDAEILAVADRSPARALQRVALEREGDLLVVGSGHHGPMARVVLGDVGRGVLDGAPCPVAVAPRGANDRTQTVTVGFDGSAEAQAALDIAARYAAEQGAGLEVCVVWDEPPMPIAAAGYLPDVDAVLEARRDAAERLLQTTLAGLPRQTAGRVLHGRPDLELARAAEATDLLVVGSRGWGPIKRIALGSTSHRLLHHAPCPVLVVPRPATGAERPTHGAGVPALA